MCQLVCPPNRPDPLNRSHFSAIKTNRPASPMCIANRFASTAFFPFCFAARRGPRAYSLFTSRDSSFARRASEKEYFLEIYSDCAALDRGRPSLSIRRDFLARMQPINVGRSTLAIALRVRNERRVYISAAGDLGASVRRKAASGEAAAKTEIPRF